MESDILEQINEASIRFLQPLTVEATYTAIVEEALKLVEGDEGYIALAEDEGLKIKYAYPPTLENITIRKRGFSYAAYVKKKAFVTYKEDFKNVHPEFVKAGIQSTIFIPLAYKEKSIGVMNIMSRQYSKRFTQRELSVLKLFGSMASLAIRKTQLYSEAKSALGMRDLFISMAAHEFRTPITTISGYAQLLKSKIKKEGAEKRWVEEIYKETQRLTRLVNELLEVNRISLGHFHYQWRVFNISKILEKVIGTFQIIHPDRQINFRAKLTEKDSIIVGDSDKITQVLINILDNAVKFSPSNKGINISLEEKNKELIIQVIDYGQGIAKPSLKRVFEGFYRGINNTKEGMGLGLFLSYQIVKEHKGQIFIKSELDKGTTVEISLPKTTVKEG